MRVAARASLGALIAAGTLAVVAPTNAGAAASGAAEATAPRVTTDFACTTPTIFLSQHEPGTQLYGGVPSAGKITFTTIGKAATWSYNGIGFDTSTKYLYAVSDYGSSKYPNGHLLEVNDAGAVTDLGAISTDGDSDLTKYGAYAGGFDSSNNLWVTSANVATVDEIDIADKPPKVIKKLTFSPALSWESNDLSYADGFMWGMSVIGGKTEIQRLNLTNGAVSDYVAPSGLSSVGVAGAAWTFGNGDLGFQSNTTGQVLEISVANASTTPTFSLVARYQGPIAGTNNDGASCAPNDVDLAATMSASPAAVDPGGKITWSITVTNNGPGISSGFAIQDPLPAGIGSVTASQGSTVCPVTQPVANGPYDVTCSEGELAVHSKLSMTISGDVTLDKPPSSVTNKVTVIGNEKDPKPTNNTASTSTPVSKGSPTISSTTPSGSGSPAGGQFTDEAVLAGGATPSGTITFKVYGPNDTSCKSTPQTVTQDVSGDGTYTSPAVTLSAVGTYEWVDSYSGDSWNLGYTGTCGTESITVGRASPTVTVTSVSATPPVLGTPFTVSASVAGLADPKTGTLTFGIYTSSSCTAPAYTSASGTAVVNADGAYTSGSLTVSAIGTYYVQVSYSGDANNNTAVSACGESFTISQTTPALSASASPASGTVNENYSDSVVLSGATPNAGGQLTFNLYPSVDQCGSGALYTVSVNVNGDGTYSSGNTELSDPGSFVWQVSYSGDTNNDPVSVACNTPSEELTVKVAINCTETWVGPQTGGIWSYGPNWSTGDIPVATDVVCIATLNPGAVVDYNGAGSASSIITQLISYAPLEMSGGALAMTGKGASSMVAGLEMTGGTIGSTTVATETIDDTAGLAWSAGSFDAPASETGSSQPALDIGSGQVVSLTNSSESFLDNWQIDTSSSIGISGFYYLQGGGSINETGSGTVTLYDGSNLYNYTGSGNLTIDASGALTKADSPGIATVGVPVSLAGPVTVPDGQLIIGYGASPPGSTQPYNSGSLTGSVTVPAGATLLLNGANLGAGATDSGAGTIAFESYVSVDPTVTLDVANIDATSGVTTVGGPIAISGSLDISGGTFIPLVPSSEDVDAVGTFTMSSGNLGDPSDATAVDSIADAGNFTWTGGSFHAISTETTPTITVPATAISTISQAYGTLDNWQLSSAGPIGMSGYVYFENFGGIDETGTATVTVDDGAYFVNDGSPGFLSISSGATLTKTDSPGTVDIDVPVSIAGTVAVPDGTMVLGYGSSTPGAASPYNSGSVSSQLTISAPATLVLNGVNLAAGATLATSGTLSFESYVSVDPSVAIDTTNVDELSGATTDDGDLTISGALDVSGGAFLPLPSDGNDYTVGSFVMSGGSLGSSDTSYNALVDTSVVDSGPFTWTGGSFETLSEASAPEMVVDAGPSGCDSLEITSPGGYLDNWVLSTACPIGIVGTVYFESAGGIDETGTSTVTLADGTDLTNEGSAGDLTIAPGAMLTKGDTPGVASAAVPVAIQGSVVVPLGTMVLGASNGPGDVYGAVSVAANAYLDLDSVNLDSGATDSGAGQIDFSDTDGIASNVTLDVDNVVEQSGTTTDAGPITVPDLFEVTGGTFIPAVPPTPQGASGPPVDTVGVLSVTGGSFGSSSSLVDSVSDSGDFFWSGGSFDASSSERPAPVINVPGTDSEVTITGPGGYLNDWVLTTPSPIGIAGYVYFENAGGIDETGTATVTVADGSYIQNGGSAGELTIPTGATLTKGNTPGLAQVLVPVTISGNVSVPQGTLDLGSSGNTGNISSPSSLSVTGTLELDSVNLNAGVTDAGTGTLVFNDTVSIDPTVTLSVANIDEIGGTTTDNGPVAIAGTLDVSSGTFIPVAETPGATDSVGQITMTGGAIGSDTTDAATLDDAGSLFWTGGSFNANGSETPQPSVSVLSTQVATITSPGGYLNNWTLSAAGRIGIAGTVYFDNHGGIDETGSGTVTLANGTDIQDEGTAGPLVVSSGATIEFASAGSNFNIGTVTVGVPFHMNGTLSLGTGQMDVGEQMTLASTSKVLETVGGTLGGLTQGLLDFDGGSSANAPVLAGSLTVSVQSGYTAPTGATYDVVEANMNLSGDTFTTITPPAGWSDSYSTGTGENYVQVQQ